MKANDLSRRGFIKRSGVVMGAAAAWSQVSTTYALEGFRPAGRSVIGKGDVVLFQGDSITDAGRSRENAMVANKQPGLGTGYAWLAAAELLVDRQDDALTFYNRGVKIGRASCRERVEIGV